MKKLLFVFSVIVVCCGQIPSGARYETHEYGFIRSAIDSDIEDELNGLPPPGRISTWGRSWRMQINALNQTGSMRDKEHVRYIIEERRRAGLPEL